MIAIGVGGNSRARDGDFTEAISSARAAAGACDVVATLQQAAFASVVKAAAEAQSVTYIAIDLDDLRGRNDDCVTHSARTLAVFGVASIAEAAALAAAGPGSRLLAARRIIGNVTVAAAQSAGPREISR